MDVTGMKYVWEPTGTLAGLEYAIANLAAAGAEAVQVLCGVANDWPQHLVDNVILGAPVPVFGGLFPGLIHAGARFERGTIAIAHNQPVRLHVVDLTTPHFNSLSTDLAESGSERMLVWFDAAGTAGPLLDHLFEEFGVHPVWLGGGAGALDFVQRPVVVTPAGLRSGVAVVASIAEPLVVGISHGWQPIGTSMQVTAASNNDVLEFDWRPAFDVYREIVEQHSGRRFATEPFFDLASRYPLVLERFDGEGIVRDPLSILPGGGIRCAGNIPAHATVRIATGQIRHMLDAAAMARARATRNGIHRGAIALAVDCISRALVLNERLQEELTALAVPTLPQLGALTIGEVASHPHGYLQLHNKTAVLGIVGP